MKTLSIIAQVFIAGLLSFCIASCSSKDDDPSSSSPSSGKIDISSTENTKPVFNTEGGHTTITFTASQPWTAAAMNNRADDWLSVSPASGNAGTATITIITKENNTYDERSGSINIKCGTASQIINVTQKQKDALLITSDKVEIDAGGGTVSIEVKANVNYTVNTDANWIEQANTRALSTSNLSFSIKENLDSSKREGHITITSGELSETVTVYQSGNVPTIILSQDQYTIGAEGGSLEIEVRSNVNVSVSFDGYEWIHQSTTRSMSTHTYVLSVLPNEDYDSRSAEFYFYNSENGLWEKVTILQLQHNAILTSKTEYNIGADGGNITVDVRSNVDVSVTIPKVDWISDATTRSLSNYSFVFAISKNTTGKERKAEVVFKSDKLNIEETITITQFGPGYYKGDITLFNDKDIADFNSKAIKIIDGDLFIKNTGNLSNIVINDQLEKVLGIIQIEGENAPISGFKSLNYANSIRLIDNSSFSLFKNLSELPGDFYYKYFDPDIKSFEGMEWLTKVGGDLSILSGDDHKGMNNIENFKGFDNLIEVKGNLTLCAYFEGLKSFYGFNKLKKIGGDLSITNYGWYSISVLRSFNGFDSLESIGGSFLVGSGMCNVESFTGLERLRYIGGDFRFVYNWVGDGAFGTLFDSLRNFRGLDKLEEIGGALDLSALTGMRIESFSGLLSLKKLGGLKIGSKLPYLDLNSFKNLKLKEIGNSGITIRSESITDLYWLSGIEIIKGKLEISSNLVNLNGLENLKEIHHSLIISGNPELKSLEGLNSLEKVGIEGKSEYNSIITITNNKKLKKFSPLRKSLQYLKDNNIGQDYNSYNVENNLYNPTMEDILNGLGDMD